jgi:hypothetical protein
MNVVKKLYAIADDLPKEIKESDSDQLRGHLVIILDAIDSYRRQEEFEEGQVRP